ncbi:integration host factor subunit beta [candidate division WOR-3 bacterium]|nr:integration host factor subunit beta [candidate division WOR-3 bacterium]
MNIRKEDIVRDIASETGLSMIETKMVVNAFMSKIIEGIMTGKRIELRGFGVFTSRKRKGRVARNPKTGEKVNVPPYIMPVFKPSRILKKTLKKG